MMWAGLLLVLCILFVAVLVWKPGKKTAASVSIQSAVDRLVSQSPAPSDPIDGEIAIIAEALREREQRKRKAAAMTRLRELLEDTE